MYTELFHQVPFKKYLSAATIALLAVFAGRQAMNIPVAQASGAAQVVNVNNGPVPAGAYARLGKGDINYVKISPDERRLAISTHIGVYMYDTATMQQLWYSEGYDLLRAPIAFSHDSRHLVGGHGRHQVVGWDVETGNIYARFDYRYTTYDITFSGDDRYVLGQSGSEVVAWDANTGQFIYWKNDPTLGLGDIAESPDGTMFASSGTVSQYFEDIAVYETATGLVLHTFEVDADDNDYLYPTALTFTPDSQYLAAGFADGRVMLWNLANGALIYTKQIPGGSIAYINFSPDGDEMAIGTTRISVYKTLTGALVRSYSNLPKNDYYYPWYSFDGTLKAISPIKEGASIVIPSTGEIAAKFEGHLTESYSGIIAPDGYSLYLGRGNGSIEKWDAANMVRVSTLSGTYKPIVLTMSSDGTLLSALHFYNWDDTISTVSTRNLTTGQKLYTILDNNITISNILLSSDGTTLLIGQANGKITRRNAKTGAPLETITNFETDEYTTSAFSGDGTRVALMQNDQITFGDLATNTPPIVTPYGPEIDTIEAMDGRFSSDGSLFAMGDSDYEYDSATIYIWDTTSGQLIHAIDDGMDHGPFAGVTSIIFSADNRTVYAGLLDGTILICNVKDGVVSGTLQGHGAAVRWLGFSPVSGHLISASEDGTVVFWQVP